MTRSVLARGSNSAPKTPIVARVISLSGQILNALFSVALVAAAWTYLYASVAAALGVLLAPTCCIFLKRKPHLVILSLVGCCLTLTIQLYLRQLLKLHDEQFLARWLWAMAIGAAGSLLLALSGTLIARRR